MLFKLTYCVDPCDTDDVNDGIVQLDYPKMQTSVGLHDMEAEDGLAEKAPLFYSLDCSRNRMKMYSVPVRSTKFRTSS